MVFEGRVQQAIRRSKSQAMEPNDVRALLLVVLIAALLVEHCDFDRIRSENECEFLNRRNLCCSINVKLFTAFAPEIDIISRVWNKSSFAFKPALNDASTGFYRRTYIQ